MRVRYNPTTRVISYLCQVPLRISRTTNLFGDLLHHAVHEHLLMVISCQLKEWSSKVRRRFLRGCLAYDFLSVPVHIVASS